MPWSAAEDTTSTPSRSPLVLSSSSLVSSSRPSRFPSAAGDAVSDFLSCGRVTTVGVEEEGGRPSSPPPLPFRPLVERVVEVVSPPYPERRRRRREGFGGEADEAEEDGGRVGVAERSA